MDLPFPSPEPLPPTILAAAERLARRRPKDRRDARLAHEEKIARSMIARHLNETTLSECLPVAMRCFDAETVRMLTGREVRSIDIPSYTPVFSWIAHHDCTIPDVEDLCQAWCDTHSILARRYVPAVVFSTAATQDLATVRGLADVVLADGTRLDIAEILTPIGGYRTDAFAVLLEAVKHRLPDMDAEQQQYIVLEFLNHPQAILALLAAGMPWFHDRIFVQEEPRVRPIQDRMSTAHGRMGIMAWRGRLQEALALDTAQALGILAGSSHP